MLLLAVAVSWSVARHGALHLHAGGWAPPLGISLHADGVSALLLLTIAVIAAILGATRAVITTGTQDARWFALWFFVWAALNALVLSNDIFNLYVTLELATLGAVGMIAIVGARDGFRVALRYMLFALPGSLIYLLGVALFYASYDTLDLGLLASRMEATPATWAALLLMFAGLALKAALFPCTRGFRRSTPQLPRSSPRCWLPSSEGTVPISEDVGRGNAAGTRRPCFVHIRRARGGGHRLGLVARAVARPASAGARYSSVAHTGYMSSPSPSICRLLPPPARRRQARACDCLAVPRGRRARAQDGKRCTRCGEGTLCAHAADLLRPGPQCGQHHGDAP